jgi:hypothetical protein
MDQRERVRIRVMRATEHADHQAPALQIGLLLVAVYLVTVAVVLPFGHRVLPLFEGTGNTSPYRWVTPPAALAPNNVAPRPNDTDVPLSATGSEQSGAQSEDNQVVLNLAPNAVPPHPPDASVRIHIEPLDPAYLGAVPQGLRANGNAYRVTMTYEPSGLPATTITAPGNVLLKIPLAAAGLLYSADGRTWTNIGKQIVAQQPVVGAPFNAPGWFLGATHALPPSSSGGGSGGVVIVAVLVGILALALGLFPLVRRRARRRSDGHHRAKKRR